ncbi:hypothetical protein ENKNEFLB_00457 [Nocardioides aquaticus]|uniref:HEAT repeat domain-containing protein n=1 Tax=Nocardioides aquaticus TaxID=160826 RepID=A0ABX8EDZ4_9ACTN|nr:HEAT repeat domain-containing protein [Nocardioides aquaticus]QVT78085.1 hypothetical protein ENKNEFLB_00457 [Nocardioides aquaticus]
MSPDQQHLVFTLDRHDLADALGVGDVSSWAWDELAGARSAQDPATVEASLKLGDAFGYDHRWCDPLVDLLGQDWHTRHEDVAFMLGRVGCVDAVPALVGATRWVPDYLDYDESRQLAVKAIHSLGRIPGDEARVALEALLDHEDHALRPRVRRVLDRRTDAGGVGS